MQHDNFEENRVTFRGDELQEFVGNNNNGTKTIYIVDDDLDDRFFSEMHLRQSQYVQDVKGFSNAVELFEYFESMGIYNHTGINDEEHLVLLDIHMPTINGIEVLDFLRTHPITSDMQVVLLTSDTCPDKVYEAHKLQATGYLQKPFSLELFDEIIKNNSAN